MMHTITLVAFITVVVLCASCAGLALFACMLSSIVSERERVSWNGRHE